MFARSHRASVRVDLSVTRWHSSTRIEFERHRSPKAHSCCTQAERSGSVNASLLLLERSNMFYCPCQDAFNVFNFCGSDNQSIACDVLRLWRLMESVSLWGGAAEYLWMASNSRGQMNCWISPPVPPPPLSFLRLLPLSVSRSLALSSRPESVCGIPLYVTFSLSVKISRWVILFVWESAGVRECVFLSVRVKEREWVRES